VSDAEVHAAAYRVMSRLRPTQLKLTDIAEEAGVTSGALVQRFGSKKGLLLSLMEGAADAGAEMFGALRSSRTSPLSTLRAYVACYAQMGETPGALAHHLAWLQMDLTDADFRRCTARMAHGTRAGLRALLEEAIAVGEVREGTDCAALARTVEMVMGGSLLAWAIYQEGSADAFVAGEVETVLAPWLKPVHAAARKRKPDRRRKARTRNRPA
jgi:AcrR family transcriptional regulator